MRLQDDRFSRHDHSYFHSCILDEGIILYSTRCTETMGREKQIDQGSPSPLSQISPLVVETDY